MHPGNTAHKHEMRANLFKTRNPMPSGVSIYISGFLKACHPTNAYTVLWYSFFGFFTICVESGWLFPLNCKQSKGLGSAPCPLFGNLFRHIVCYETFQKCFSRNQLTKWRISPCIFRLIFWHHTFDTGHRFTARYLVLISLERRSHRAGAQMFLTFL